MTETYSFKRVFFAAGLGLLLFGVGFISLGSVLPSIIEKFEMDTVQAGLLASLPPFGILLGSLVFGPIVDRYSYRIPFIISTLLIILGMESIAYSGSILQLQMIFILMGFGGGILNGGTNALVADISSERPGSRGANLSLLGAFFGIGALGVPLLMALLPETWGFERKISYIGFTLIIPVLYFALIKFPAPKQTQSIPLKSLMSVIKHRGLLILGMILFFESALEGIVNNWTTSFLQTGNNFSEARSLMGLSVFILCLTLTRLLLAGLLRKIKSYIILVVSLCIILSGLLIIIVFPTPAFFFIALGLLGFGTSAVFPVVLGYVGSQFSDLRGTAYSLVFSIALLGNITFIYLMGIVADRFSIRSFPWVLMVCLGFVALLIISSARKYGKD